MNLHPALRCLTILALALARIASSAPPIDPEDLPAGIRVFVCPSDPSAILEGAAGSPGVVHGLYDEEAGLKRARRAIQEAGLYGRISVSRCAWPYLPYAENLVNCIVVEDFMAAQARGLTVAETLRALAPLGVAILGNPGREVEAAARAAGGVEIEGVVVEGRAALKIRKVWPADIDEWPHSLHGADGNPVANDRVVGPPRRYQWLAGPAWAQSHESDSNLRNLITARGRLYYIVNEAPASLAGPESPPDKWRLTARDAFNGTLLWQVPVEEWGWRQWKPSWFTPRPGVIPLNLDKRLVAAGDTLFFTLGFRAPVSRIDGRTGKTLATFEGTERTSEILHVADTLVLTQFRDGRAVVKRVDAGDGRLLWTSDKDYGGTVTDYYRFSARGGEVPAADVDPTLNIAADGKAIALLDGDGVVCLDAESGKERWKSTFPLAEKDHKAGRISALNKVWVGTLIVRDGVILHASPNKLAAFDAESGEVIWEQPKAYLQHLWYEWKDVFVIEGLVWTWSARLVREPLKAGKGGSVWPATANGYDLRTGKLVKEVPLGRIFKTHHHHRCYRNKATVNYIIASRRGSEFVDLRGGKHSIHNWVRGACHMGMVPANGLQYAPPHPCQCYIDEKLNGLNALAPAPPAGADPSGPVASPRDRLVKGPAYGGAAGAPASGWTTFRADPVRSGFAKTSLPGRPKELWRVGAGSRVGAPVLSGGAVYVPLVDEHAVLAMDAATGRERWRFTTGARVDSPPTCHEGGVVFGSADGWVYRVRASDGALEWKFHAAPVDRLIGAFGQLESAWPVHGSVLVHDGAAVFAAGRSSQIDGGLRLFALDARTGAVRTERTLDGPYHDVDSIEDNYELPMGVQAGIFHLEDSNIFMRGVPFDAATLARASGAPRLKVGGGFLDDAFFKRMPWAIGGSGHARVLVHDNRRAYCLRMFDSMAALDPKVFFTPGKKGYLFYASDLKTGKQTWGTRVPIRGRALVVTNEHVCLAGPPDIVDPRDPLGAFEGRKGGILRIVDKINGATVAERRLPSPPVFHGAAAADGQLVLTLRDGSVVCLGRRSPTPPEGIRPRRR